MQPVGAVVGVCVCNASAVQRVMKFISNFVYVLHIGFWAGVSEQLLWVWAASGPNAETKAAATPVRGVAPEVNE
jgi:hypothetical protein